jgi:hypothetical protein
MLVFDRSNPHLARGLDAMSIAEALPNAGRNKSSKQDRKTISMGNGVNKLFEQIVDTQFLA